MEGIAVQHAGAGAGGGNKLGAVVAQNGDLIAHAGQHALAAAGEAGEEVRLNEALGHQQVGLHRQPVNDAIGAGGEHADLHVGGGVPAVVNHNGFMVHDVLTQLANQLLFGGGAVEAGGNQQGDLDVRIAPAQLGQHMGQNVLAGTGRV